MMHASGTVRCRLPGGVGEQQVNRTWLGSKVMSLVASAASTCTRALSQGCKQIKLSGWLRM